MSPKQRRSEIYACAPICLAGLEVFFGEGAAEMGGSSWGSPSAFFAFASKKERERAAAAFMAEPCLGSGLAGGHIAAAAAASILEVGSGFKSKCFCACACSQ